MRNRRLQLGLSQHELAIRAGLQRTYITDVERHARAITLKSAWKLAVCLEVRLSVLVTEAESVSLPEKSKEKRPPNNN